ncbi:uncharacterized protein LOC113278842 [Papaver somniferum]|uniref:uncharacterized protein LOC113278842 n=1 Tax=Papaver somniferum TaxID=3469 RepID=UPI000E6FCC10|nr:uncharacterized protein LOC113278842 [Papaver somniferum]
MTCYNKRKVNFTGTHGSSSQSSLSTAHKFGKFRTRVGGPKLPTTSTTMEWRPIIAASWEILYCEEEGSIPWKRIAKTQKLMKTWALDDEFKRCWEWDASSGEEALGKVKDRYWRKLNGIPFKTLTNEESADMYNDTNIDWNPNIDPEISLSLDRDDAIFNEGWSDRFADDYLRNKDEKFTVGWGTYFQDPRKTNTGE